MKNSNKLFFSLTDILLDNAADFFFDKKSINLFINPDDLVNDPSFEKFRPFNKNTDADLVYNTFVDLIKTRMKSLLLEDKKSLITSVVQYNIGYFLDVKFDNDLRKLLKLHENNGLFNKVEKLVSSYKKKNSKILENKTLLLTENILKDFDNKIHNLIFDPVDTLLMLDPDIT